MTQLHRPARLLAHLEIPDMDRMREGSAPKPYGFDGFTYGHQGQRENQVDELVAAGLQCYRYFNVLTYPESAWVYRGSPWFDWQADVMLRQWRLYHAVGNREPARFRWFNQVLLWGWSRMMNKPAHLHGLVDTIATMARGSRVFLDQFWRWDYPWMYHESGAQYGDFSAMSRLKWWGAVNRFLQLLLEELARRHGPADDNVLINGEDSIGQPGALNEMPRAQEWPLVPEDQCIPVYLEHAQADWDGSLALLALNPDHSVLSVDPMFTHHKERAIAHWLEQGGWLAFSSRAGGQVQDLAYMEADQARTERENQPADPRPAVSGNDSGGIMAPGIVQLPAAAPPPGPPVVKPVRKQVPRQRAPAPPAPPKQE